VSKISFTLLRARRTIFDGIPADVAAILGKFVQYDPLNRHDNMSGENTDHGTNEAAGSSPDAKI
jgi:hypothetical protein